MNMRDKTNIDYTTRDYEGFRHDMLELLKKKIPQYSDFSESDMGVVLIELLSHGLDIVSFYNDKVANEIFPNTAMERESIIKHCRRLGYELKHSVPSRFHQVFKIHPQERDYVIPRGTIVTSYEDTSIEFEVIQDLVIPKGETGVEKDDHGNYKYFTVVEHGNTVDSDIIGSSNGSAYQEFILSYAPIILESLKIYVRDEFNIEEWTRVDNFIDSDNTSKQYMTEVTENDYVKILFGSGVSGIIPPIYEDGISASYRVGGGIVGNVSLYNITEMPSKPAVIIETFNFEQIQVGRDKETIEEARVHAPQSLKTLWRAVCLEDYENLLYQEFAGEIIQCRAVAEDDRYTISLYVLTNNVDEDLPTDSKEKFLEFLDNRKEIGYNLRMFEPTYENVTLNLTITTNKAYENSYIEQIVQAYIESNYLTKGKFEFGEALITSQLIKDLMVLPGVYDVVITHEGNITPSKNKILKLNTNISVDGGM